MEKIGILGGGQLAMMMIESARKIGITSISVLDPNKNCPAGLIGAKVFIGSYKNEEDIINFSKNLDILTIDIESVNLKGLENISSNCKVYPSLDTIRFIQNKYNQKIGLAKLGIKIPNIYNIKNYHYNDEKFIVKTKNGGYDGKGVWIMENKNELDNFLLKNNLYEEDIFIEEFINIEKEYAIIAYLYNGIVYFYPIVETVQEDGICKEVICPTPLNNINRRKIKNITEKVLKSFNTKGIFAIEYFYDGIDIYLNEISPRVHNSGHFSIEATNCSQFEQHMRLITDLECIEPKLLNDIFKMTNILGTGNGNELTKYINTPNLHWYNKEMTNDFYKKNRKIGHYTEILKVYETPFPLIYVVMGSISDLPVMEPCIELLKNNNINVQVDIVSAHRSPKWLYDFGDNIESWCGKVIIAGAGGAAHLPGMLASLTNIPVIGVPVPTSNLGGQDSLYSIVQMPDGVPVATVGIGKSKNAAILAMKVLNMKDELNEITWKNEKKVDNQREELHLLHDNFFR